MCKQSQPTCLRNGRRQQEHRHGPLSQRCDNKSVLLCNLPTPTIFGFSFQSLRMSQARLRMLKKFANELQSLCIDFGFMAQQFFQVCLRFLLDNNLIQGHRLRINLSRSSTFSKALPGCFSTRSNFAKNSSFVIKVGSSFSLANFLAYRVKRFIIGSLSAIAPILCQSSVFIVFNCTAVI